MDDKSQSETEAKTTSTPIVPVPSRNGEYARIAKLSPKAVATLEKLLDSPNPSVRLGAANTVLNKVIPNLKAIEVTGETNSDGTKQPIQLLINRGGGFIPATVSFDATSTTSTAGSASVQDPHMAQAGTQNDNSDIRNDSAGTS